MNRILGRFIVLAVVLGLVLPALPGCGNKEGEDPILKKKDSRNEKIEAKQDAAASGE